MQPTFAGFTFDIPEVEDGGGSGPNSPLMAPVKPVAAPTRRKSMLIRKTTNLKSASEPSAESVRKSGAGSPHLVDTTQSTASTPNKHPPSTGSGTPTNHSIQIPSSSAITITQSNSTSLPNELLELIREFRVRIEKVAAFVNTGESNAAAQNLHHSGNDIIRYVTNFLIQKHEEEVRYEQKKLVGWAAASHIKVDEHGRLVNDARVDPAILGPFILNALYAVMESLLITLKCDRGRIFLPDGGLLRAVVSVGGGAVVAPEKAEWDRVAGSVFRSGVAINVGDTNKAPPQFTSSADDVRGGYLPRSILCFPLFGNGHHESDNPPVIGVVEFMNKVRTAAFMNGFSEKDEEAAHHYSELIANLIRWGAAVDFCNQTSLEEGAKIQAMLLAQRHVAHSQWRLQSNAGSRNISRTEAKVLIEKQVRKEEKLRSHMDAGLKAFQYHPFLLAADRQNEQRSGLIFRVACATDHTSDHNTSFVTSEALSVIRNGGNVRELLQMLEQFDVSWKTARHNCVALERRVEELEAALRCEQGNTRALRQLCESCGITPPSSTIRNFNFSEKDMPKLPQLLESGTLNEAVATHHTLVLQQLKQASSKTTNLGRRLRTTTEQSCNPRKADCESRLDELLRKVERQIGGK